MSISDDAADVALQESLADSLVAPLDNEGQPISQGEDGDYSEQESGEHDGQLNDRDQINAELWEQAEQIERGSEQESEQAAAQPTEVTPQAVQAGIQELEQQVNDLGLNDPAEASLLANSLGVDSANSGALGSVLAKTTLSALNVLQECQGDFSKIPPISREAARAFSNEFMRAVGADPRMSQADPQQLTSVVLHGALSFLQAVNTYGLNASLDTLNTPEASEFFANALFQCFGSGERADRQYSLAISDAAGRYMLSVLRRLDGAQQSQPRQARQSQSRQSQGRRATPARQKSSGRVAMRTNTDLFDDEALDYYQHQHGRL